MLATLKRERVAHRLIGNFGWSHVQRSFDGVLELHRLALSEPADLWYSGGGPFDDRRFGFAARPSNGESRLATQLDLSAQWRWSPQLAINGYIGWANGGAGIDRIHPTGSDAALGYLEVEWRR